VPLKAHIEHTLLRANASPQEIDVLCDEALEQGFVGVCVNPAFVPRVVQRIGGRCRVVSVVGFPLGAGSEASDVAEARWLVDQGADELDLVVPISSACSGAFDDVQRRVVAVRTVASSVTLKVILETGYFAHDALLRLAQEVLAAGPNYLKTSTGFGPKGALVEEVEALKALCGDRALVKASGGIKTAAQAKVLLAAGASRLGTSSGVAIAREV
jgi:deoxyribose-phosphate aldolase